MKRLALAVLLCLAPSSVFADIMVWGAPTKAVTLDEGTNSNPIQFTIQNESSASASAVTINTPPDFIAHYVSGDRSDSAQLTVTAHDPFPCAGTNLRVSSTCEFNLIIETPSDAGETDGDQGVWDLEVGVKYTLPNGNIGEAFSSLFQVTVTDPASVAPVPEPAGVCLFATVLVASALLMKRKRRAGFKT